MLPLEHTDFCLSKMVLMIWVRLPLNPCGDFHCWWLDFWGAPKCSCFNLCFSHCCVSLLFLFQKSLRLINRAFKTNVWRALGATHQKSSKHISKPAASYFLTSPYARLGWLVIFSSHLPLNFLKFWVHTKRLLLIIWILFKGESANQLVLKIWWNGLCCMSRTAS